MFCLCWSVSPAMFIFYMCICLHMHFWGIHGLGWTCGHVTAASHPLGWSKRNPSGYSNQSWSHITVRIFNYSCPAEKTEGPQRCCACLHFIFIFTIFFLSQIWLNLCSSATLSRFLAKVGLSHCRLNLFLSERVMQMFQSFAWRNGINQKDLCQ